jgi:hypothetical protein
MTPGPRSSSVAPFNFRRSRRRESVLLLAAALSLAACSSGSDGSSDTTPPTVTVTDDVTAATATGDVTFSFTFSEDVGSSFIADDVGVTHGTKGAFTRVASTLYRLVVTPEAGAAGTIEVTVAAGRFADLAGNPNAAPATATQDFDTVVVLAQMSLPVTFDSTTVDYGLVGFEGADDSTIAADPDPANTTNRVARVVKAGDAQAWAGTTVTAIAGLVQTGFASKLPFDASNTRMTVRVYSPDVGTVVRLKAEDHTDPTVSVETEATTTLAGAWEQLTFDFAQQANGTAALDVTKTYDKVSLFFGFGTAGAGTAKTYYFDDLEWLGGGGIVTPPAEFSTVTFDDAGVTYTLTGFGGADPNTIETDPAGGTNHVAKVVKQAAAADWAGTTFATGANASVGKIPFDASNTRMTVRVYTPASGLKVRLKAEDASTAGHTVETDATTSVAGAWETLTFDFAQQASGTAAIDFAFTYDKLSIFFDFGSTGTERICYFDDVTFIGGGGVVVVPPFANVTFDEAAVTYSLVGFGGVDGANSTVAADPVSATNQVGKVFRPDSAETWAGTTVVTGAGNTVGKIPFAAGKTIMTVRVYAPAAGLPVRLKVEDAANAAHSVETEATTTSANAWETLTFDFASQAGGTAAIDFAYTYDRLSIFFNFGAPRGTAGDATWYLDDVTFVP